jgi:hypothetical protein
VEKLYLALGERSNADSSCATFVPISVSLVDQQHNQQSHLSGHSSTANVGKVGMWTGLFFFPSFTWLLWLHLMLSQFWIQLQNVVWMDRKLFPTPDQTMLCQTNTVYCL